MAQSGLRRWAQQVTESARFQRAILLLIVINAITLGLETSAAIMASMGPWLLTIDALILAIFVAELALKGVAQRRAFFAQGWNIFDLAVVVVALIPEAGPWAVLRALRVLRVFRMVSALPRLRHVVESMLRALPGMGSIASLLLLVFYVFYVFSVMATELFGAAFPDWFGNIGASMFSLFQVMTLESWSMGIVRPVMEVFPWAWAFFVPFILVTTFSVLNLFIAIVVNAVQQEDERGPPPQPADSAQGVAADPALARELAQIQARLAVVQQQLHAAEPVAESTPGDQRRAA